MTAESCIGWNSNIVLEVATEIDLRTEKLRQHYMKYLIYSCRLKQ